MIFRLLELYKNKRLVRRQVLNNDPPEARAAYDEMISLHWPKWRIWMVLASAYQTESRMAASDSRQIDFSHYKILLRNAGKYPDGYTAEDAREVLDESVKRP